MFHNFSQKIRAVQQSRDTKTQIFYLRYQSIHKNHYFALAFGCAVSEKISHTIHVPLSLTLPKFIIRAIITSWSLHIEALVRPSFARTATAFLHQDYTILSSSTSILYHLIALYCTSRLYHLIIRLHQDYTILASPFIKITPFFHPATSRLYHLIILLHQDYTISYHSSYIRIIPFDHSFYFRIIPIDHSSYIRIMPVDNSSYILIIPFYHPPTSRLYHLIILLHQDYTI